METLSVTEPEPLLSVSLSSLFKCFFLFIHILRSKVTTTNYNYKTLTSLAVKFPNCVH